MTSSFPKRSQVPGLGRIVLWALAFWGTIGGGVLVSMRGDATNWWRIFPFWLLAVGLLGAKSASAIRGLPARGLQVAFWLGTILEIALVGGFVDRNQERFCECPDPIGWLVLILLGLGLWAFGKRRTGDTPEEEVSLAEDATVRLFWLGLVAGTVYLVFDTLVVPWNIRAVERKWAEIGRPMAEFEREYLAPVDENQSLRDLAKDLARFDVGSLYKAPLAEPDSHSLSMPDGIVDMLSLEERPEDTIPPLPTNPAVALSGTALHIVEGVRFLNERANDLDHLYRGILSRPRPVWGIDPRECPIPREPNYLPLRKLCQLIFVDSRLKTQRGEVQGAQRAVAAASRAVEDLGQQPTMVSLLIYESICALLERAYLRLPEEPGELARLAARVDTQREQFRRVLQTEAWRMFKAIKGNNRELFYTESPFAQMRFGKSITLRICWPWVKLAELKGCLLLAHEFQILERSPELAASDLGKAQLEAYRKEKGKIFDYTPNFVRSHLRLNFILMLHEQVTLLRTARTQMNNGRSGVLMEWPSTVAPGSKWVATGDAVAKSVTLKLTPMPEWMKDFEVIDNHFFPLPPDGSKGWKFQ